MVDTDFISHGVAAVYNAFCKINLLKLMFIKNACGSFTSCARVLSTSATLHTVIEWHLQQEAVVE